MKVLVVDAYNMIHRARFGFGQGEHAIVFNFFRSVRSEIDRHMPDLVYLVSEGVPQHRLILNPDYKGQRTPVVEEGFHRQKREIFDLSRSFPLIFMRHPDFECDDAIGHICTSRHTQDEVVIVSSDSDFIQLLEWDNVSLWNPVRKKFIDRWPVDYITWKSLKGDPTDNVPGIKGIGEKRAFSLCEDPAVLKSFLEADPTRQKIFESARAQIRLADIDQHCKKWEIKPSFFNEALIRNTFTDYQFKSIIGKAWSKWCTTMERLNDKLQTDIIARTADHSA